MAKHDQRGRTKKSPRFVMLLHHMLESPAYRSLKPPARAVYTEVLFRYNGLNNGDIPLSCREAAKLCNISDGTASRAFKTLIEHGFIKVGKASGFNMKNRVSTRWIITHEAIDATIAPTHEWKEWRPAPCQNQTTVSPEPLTVSSETP